MGIEWCHHTFNPWRGCTKVSAGCKNCYAETMSKRNPTTLGIWGLHGTRPIAAEAYWKQPIKWNKDAELAGVRRRVFCSSLADVFEGPETMPKSEWPNVEAARTRLFDLIERTPWLDWLLLTNRPKNIARFAPSRWGAANERRIFDDTTLLPSNVWIGTSAENQQTANKRIPYLLRVPARVRFLSCEPLLRHVDLRLFDAWLPEDCYELRERLHWVIVGGESGHESDIRPMHPDWVRSLRDQCVAAEVPFFMKQWGEYKPVPWPMESPNLRISPLGLITDSHSSGHIAEIEAWPWVSRVGKKNAGRLLDGQEWNQFPVNNRD